MSKRIDLTGQKFERLKVISYAGTDKRGKALWKCECKCGNTKIVIGTDLSNGHTKSCGCIQKENTSISNTKHGDTESRLWRIWSGIMYRTGNKNNKRQKDYIGRGIDVCDEWKEYIVFRNWALQNGYSDKLTIDRKDNDKGYNPDNCRWVTTKENNRNKRNTVMIEYEGEKKPLIEWAEIMGINHKTVKTRIRRGWSTEKALETPVQRKMQGTNHIKK